MNPYVPIFSSTPARITDPAVGACTCACGSQVWKGKMGTLMANASAKAKKSSPCSRGPRMVDSCRKSKYEKVGVPKIACPLKNMYRIATSISSDPAVVYRKNLTAAYTRSLPPQIPMRKYMGMRTISQNT
jgi:hypothetical protein